MKKLSEEIVKGIKTEPAIKSICDAGASELPGDADALARHMVAEKLKWKKVIDVAKLKPQ